MHECGMLCQMLEYVMTTPPQKEIPLSEHGIRTTRYYGFDREIQEWNREENK